MVSVIFFLNLTSSFGLLNYSVSLKLTLPLVTSQFVLFHKQIAAVHHTQFFRTINMQIKFISPAGGTSSLSLASRDFLARLGTSSLVFAPSLAVDLWQVEGVVCKKTAPKNT